MVHIDTTGAFLCLSKGGVCRREAVLVRGVISCPEKFIAVYMDSSLKGLGPNLGLNLSTKGVCIEGGMDVVQHGATLGDSEYGHPGK